MLWDRGTWTPLMDDIDAALADGELKFTLQGVKLKGSWVLVRTRDDRTWLLIKHRDEWAGDVSVTEEFPLSVKSDGDFEDILAQEKPDVWESHRPAQGGVAGKMFQEIIDKAARKKLAKKKSGSTRATRKKTTSRR
jgi:bifunctional non-homologous end joining protein LigD